MARGQRTVRVRYIVKQRQFIRIVNRAFGGRVASYGKWTTIARTFEREKAVAIRAEKSRVGLQQTVVVFRGKILVDSQGYQRER